MFSMIQLLIIVFYILSLIYMYFKYDNIVCYIIMYIKDTGSISYTLLVEPADFTLRFFRKEK